jgi:hypothetical protein
MNKSGRGLGAADRYNRPKEKEFQSQTQFLNASNSFFRNDKQKNPLFLS